MNMNQTWELEATEACRSGFTFWMDPEVGLDPTVGDDICGFLVVPFIGSCRLEMESLDPRRESGTVAPSPPLTMDHTDPRRDLWPPLPRLSWDFESFTRDTFMSRGLGVLKIVRLSRNRALEAISNFWSIGKTFITRLSHRLNSPFFELI